MLFLLGKSRGRSNRILMRVSRIGFFFVLCIFGSLMFSGLCFGFGSLMFSGLCFGEDFVGIDSWAIIKWEDTVLSTGRFVLSGEIVGGNVKYKEYSEVYSAYTESDGKLVVESSIIELTYGEDWNLETMFLEEEVNGILRIVKGAIDGQKLYLTVAEDDNIEEYVLDLPEDFYSLESPNALVRRLGKDIVIGETYHGYIIDTDIPSFVKSSMTISGKTAYEYHGKDVEVYVIDIDFGGFHVQEYVDLNGESYFASYPNIPDLYVYKVEENEVPETFGYDVSQMESRTETLETGLVDRAYTNAEYGFRISLPNKDWNLLPVQSEEGLSLYMQPVTNDSILVQLMIDEIPFAGIITPKVFIDLLITQLSEQLEGLSVVEISSFTVNGYDASKADTEVHHESGIAVISFVVVIHEESVYYFMYGAPGEVAAEYEGEFMSIVNSLEIL